MCQYVVANATASGRHTPTPPAHRGAHGEGPRGGHARGEARRRGARLLRRGVRRGQEPQALRLRRGDLPAAEARVPARVESLEDFKCFQ